MAIKVCDAIMGTGKSSAAINYFNEHKNQRFIYITPYLDEAKRIKKGCPDMDFIEPSDKIKKFKFRKSEHTAALIRAGMNIATTHQSFKMYNESMLEDIKALGYTLVIDENIDVLESFEFHRSDLDISVDAGRVIKNGNEYSLVDKTYDEGALSDMFDVMRSRTLLCSGGDDDESIFYWALPKELLLSFDNVIVMTYLFEGQSLYYFMKMYDIPYQKIGVEKCRDGKFRFSETEHYIPGYVRNIGDMIEILDSPKMNRIGDKDFSLSLSWYKRGGNNMIQLKRNMSNYFNNICRGIPAGQKLWGSFNVGKNKLKGKGYTTSFLSFNAKATNAYRDRTCLAYPVNLFMNVSEKLFYKNLGIRVNEDVYALSIMIQWIWRSAIRDGKGITIYIPSKRMRELLIKWINIVERGGDVIEKIRMP